MAPTSSRLAIRAVIGHGTTRESRCGIEANEASYLTRVAQKTVHRSFSWRSFATFYCARRLRTLRGTSKSNMKHLRQINPGLVLCTISSFDLPGQDERLSAYEGFVAARCGRFFGNDVLSGAHSSELRPVYLAAPLSSFGAANLAVQGIAAALLARQRSGIGQRVETSMLDGISAATMRMSYRRDGEEVVPVRNRQGSSDLLHRGIRISFLTAECADHRYIQMCARMPHTFKNWLNALNLEYLGEERRFADMPYGLQSEADAEHLETLIREQMMTKAQSEWMDLFINRYDVGADPFLTFDEFLVHPQMTENERVIKIPGPPEGGITEIGPLNSLLDHAIDLRSACTRGRRASIRYSGDHRHLAVVTER